MPQACDARNRQRKFMCFYTAPRNPQIRAFEFLMQGAHSVLSRRLHRSTRIGKDSMHS